MSERQARVCVYCAAGAVALSIATLVLVIMFSIGFQQTLNKLELQGERDNSALRNWSIAIYEKLDASGCVVTPLPKVPLKEE